ncbi:hypothetical protein [Roseomonas marmotae]|uniref:Bacteriocin n=1 Tax=Roseomonas marmotae TaxID=2768161 RepID=A0ABS3KG03_9PROT|nr:hypothetical protein [Roseomonas marmotae]MBO1076402.1 hypothetical protein [Roseomonas marmotae]QTI79390.1 hypothetical protein IAI58_00730 [Roseomonas marmotae]
MTQPMTHAVPESGMRELNEAEMEAVAGGLSFGNINIGGSNFGPLTVNWQQAGNNVAVAWNYNGRTGGLRLKF